MILGIGSDLIDIRRIEQALDRFGDRFVQRLFTADERACAERRIGSGRAATYAKRFAAKEAGVKALGTGFRHGIFFQDLSVAHDAEGRPLLEMSGAALKRLNALTPQGMIAHLHLSLTDDYPLAQAFVILSAVPAPGVCASGDRFLTPSATAPATTSPT